jgi:hypothetical protein
VREFLKWDDQPASLQHFAESAVRAYKIATTPLKQQLRDPVRVIPPYSQTVVSDKEAANIYAFLQTLSGRRPAKDFPILNN